jgi:hypothetical protein
MEILNDDRITTGAAAGLVKLCWTSHLLLGLCDSSLIWSVIEQVVVSDERKCCGKKYKKTIFQGINHTAPNNPE